MNKWEKHGYDHCVSDYENFGIKFCTNELERMLELTKELKPIVTKVIRWL